MKKRFAIGFCSVAFGLMASAACADEAKYISPNNDGVQDELIVNFNIRDKSKIMSWALVIEDASGTAVRTIGNKVALPTSLSASGFFKQIVKRKTSVEVPPSVVWNGALDTGETAPDGEYFYYITAEDERGNATQTAKMPVIVKNTAPFVELSALPEGERVFGEGDKVFFKIEQSGSKEGKWTGEIRNSSGEIVRIFTWEDSEPQTFEWNGADGHGMILPDGIYSYSIRATDKAGNTNAPAGIANIIFSAERPVTDIQIVGSPYFSVAPKSDITSVKLAVAIPEPKSAGGNAISDWSVQIRDKGGRTVRTYNKKNSVEVPSEIVFDGKADSGALAADGEYTALLLAEYLNGYKTPPVRSPVFVLDTVPPSATIEAFDDIFSPDGDGNKDVFTLRQKIPTIAGSPIKNWTSRIFKAGTDEAVFELDFGSAPPPEFKWSGLGKDAHICDDGDYVYELSATDEAGNSFSTRTRTSFRLDTSRTEVLLTANQVAFNPKGERDNVVYSCIIKSTSVSAYKFEIRDEVGAVVYSLDGNDNAPATITWDGKWNGNVISGAPCRDGTYIASISIVSKNGSSARAQALPVIIDTVPPFVEVAAEYTLFSPSENSSKDKLKVTTKRSTMERAWTAQILDEGGSIVKTFEWQLYPSGKQNGGFEWDGSADNGNKARDGKYSILISATDIAGNEFSKKIEGIVLDSRPVSAYVTAALPGISPVSRTGMTSQKFDVRLSLADGIEAWNFDVRNANGATVKSFAGNAGPVPAQLVWDGIDSTGRNCEGNFTGHLAVRYAKGNVAQASTTPFICSSTPPILAVSTRPEFFSPDNDGVDDDLFVGLSGKATSPIKNWSFVINYPESTGKKGAFWQTGGTDRITPQITWDGLSNTNREKDGSAERVQSALDYPYVFTVTDSLGMTSEKTGVIPVDILVVRDGDWLKMAVPSIIFRSNAADFKTANEPGGQGSRVTPEQAANNVRVLRRVSDILKKFPDYTVTVVGHANRTGTPGEDDILLSLSNSRAAFVKDWLVKNGRIPEKRLSSEGKGASAPVAEFGDTENWWKNRRVEFILHK